MNTNQNLPNNNIIFYNVYLYGFDSEKCDILLNIRQSFFASNSKSKDKVYLTVDGQTQKYFYTIEPNKPLKWKKQIGNTVVEQGVSEATNSYYINTTENGNSVKKQYFNNNHIWQKTEYIDTLIKENNCSLVPWTNEKYAAIVKYTENINNPIVLSVVTTPQDKVLLQQLIALAPPTAMAQTSVGYFCFCDPQSTEKWYSALKNLTTPKEAKQEQKSSPTSGFSFTSSDFSEQTEETDVFAEATVFGEEICQAEKLDKMKTTKHSKQAVTKQEADNTVIAEEKIELPNNKTQNEDKNNNKQNDSTPYTINVDKIIPISETENYLYCGSLDKDGNRDGYGRTILPNGKTAYDGMYTEDMRSGFGAYYYKNGKPCYVGNWENNKRNGLGIAFRTSDYSTHIGQFENDAPKGNCARFDKFGNLTYVGNWSRGTKNGAGIQVNEKDGSYLIATYKKGEQPNKGTIVNKDGTLQYTGEIINGEKAGIGTQFYQNGAVEYSGSFKKNKFCGTGKLYLADGSTVCGKFKNNKPDGECIMYNSNGAICYKGQFINGAFSGNGTSYLDDGSYITGVFENNQPVGSVILYDKQGKIVYNGTMQNGKYNGEGILFKDAKKVYDGRFIDGKKFGTGKEYENDACTYMGSFENDAKNGFGISYINNKPQYTGMWKNGVYNVAGILCENDTCYVGEFADGKLNGRVNVVENGIIIASCIYEKGLCTYKREYSADGTYLIFEGNIKDNQKEGMGCSFTEYGDKSFEGIFKLGQPFKGMKISLKPLEDLPFIEKLKTTDYDKFRVSADFAIEEPVGVCIYSGMLKGGVPNGKGTALYGNHKFTGNFKDGNAIGKGIICLDDGTEICGSFTCEKLPSSKEIKTDGITYFYI